MTLYFFKTILLILILTTNIHGQENIGFLVCVTENNKTSCARTHVIDSLQRVCDNCFPSIVTDIENQLDSSLFIHIITQTTVLYIEKKRIIVRKNGKKVYKRVKSRY